MELYLRRRDWFCDEGTAAVVHRYCFIELSKFKFNGCCSSDVKDGGWLILPTSASDSNGFEGPRLLKFPLTKSSWTNRFFFETILIEFGSNDSFRAVIVFSSPFLLTKGERLNSWLRVVSAAFVMIWLSPAPSVTMTTWGLFTESECWCLRSLKNYYLKLMDWSFLFEPKSECYNVYYTRGIEAAGVFKLIMPCPVTLFAIGAILVETEFIICKLRSWTTSSVFVWAP